MSVVSNEGKLRLGVAVGALSFPLNHSLLVAAAAGWDALLLQPHNGYVRKIKRLYVLFTRQWQTVTISATMTKAQASVPAAI
jgi:hypothetical protein